MCIDKWLKRPAFLSFFMFAGSVCLAAETPAQPLFFIERSKNANEVHYVARLTEKSVLDARKPVHAFWINWEKDSTGKNREDLNLIEKRMAYGFSVERSRSPHSCTMKLVCFRNRPIRVYLNDGIARAETIINGQSAHLKKISIVTREKKTIVPQVLSVTVYGTDAETGKEITETIIP
jgi:hypothetical protein